MVSLDSSENHFQNKKMPQREEISKACDTFFFDDFSSTIYFSARSLLTVGSFASLLFINDGGAPSASIISLI